MLSSLDHGQPMVSFPGYFLFRPWSHTDKRNVLKLHSSSLGKKALVKEAMSRVNVPGVQAAFLEQVELLNLKQVVRSDRKRSKKFLRPDFHGLRRKHLKFVVVSWSPRYPDHLNIESRPMAMLRDAYLFAMTEKEIHAAAERTYCVMRLLSPKTANLSP